MRLNLSSCDCAEIRTQVSMSEGFEVTNWCSRTHSLVVLIEGESHARGCVLLIINTGAVEQLSLQTKTNTYFEIPPRFRNFPLPYVYIEA